jgi:hypothetical protein
VGDTFTIKSLKICLIKFSSFIFKQEYRREAILDPTRTYPLTKVEFVACGQNAHRMGLLEVFR